MDFISKRIICPFYMKHQKREIKCEGIITEGCVNNFESEQKMRMHLGRYCSNQYKECPFAKILFKKYD